MRPHPSRFSRAPATLQPLTEALTALARVLDGRIVEDWRGLAGLSEFLEVERAAALCDHRQRLAARTPETRGAREDSCRWAVVKFLATGGFFDALAAGERIDAAEIAQEFFRQLYRQKGMVTQLVPLAGIAPSHCQLSSEARLAPLSGPYLRQFFRLADPADPPVPMDEWIGLCGLELNRSSASPEAWDRSAGGTDVQRVFDQTWPYLSLLHLHPAATTIRPRAFYESSDRIVDWPATRGAAIASFAAADCGLARKLRVALGEHNGRDAWQAQEQQLAFAGPATSFAVPGRTASSARRDPNVGGLVQQLVERWRVVSAESPMMEHALRNYTEAIVILADQGEGEADEETMVEALECCYRGLETIFAPARGGIGLARHVAACAAGLFGSSDSQRRRLHQILSLGYDVGTATIPGGFLSTHGDLLRAMRLVSDATRSALVWCLRSSGDREELG